jgi:LacI family transcriptional regulator
VAKFTGDPERHNGRRTTLAEIAAEAGVSLPTVSKVLNDRGDVAPATRARIQELLNQHRYERGGAPARRGLRVFSVVFTGLQDPWAVEILRGIEEWCARHSAAVMLSAVPHSGENLAAALDSRRCDGVLLATTWLTAPVTDALRASALPAVVVDPANDPPTDLPSIGATNWAGGLAASEHLITLGHRRIAVITGPAYFHCSLARLDGFRSALDRAGIAADPALVRYGDFSVEGGLSHGAELLALPDPPTAIFAGNDQQALGVYEAARQRGLRVPEDLSVVGFDDLPIARWASPPLTTIWQPLAEMGTAAARMLGHLIEDRAPHPKRVELSTELIVRASTSPPLSSRAASPAGKPGRRVVDPVVVPRPGLLQQPSQAS